MKRHLIIVAGLTVLVLAFQNCGNKVNFTPTLTSSGIDQNGNVVQSTVPNPDLPSSSPTATPSSSPSSSPSPTPAPSPVSSTGSDELCVLVNSGNSGMNNKVGVDVGVTYLQSQNGIPNAVCMSANACLVLVNDYLNLTGGSFSTAPASQPPAVTVNYTMQKINSVCAHNPNVVHLSDAEVQAALDRLKNHLLQ